MRSDLDAFQFLAFVAIWQFNSTFQEDIFVMCLFYVIRITMQSKKTTFSRVFDFFFIVAGIYSRLS